MGLTARRRIPAAVLSYAEQRALEIGITIAGGAEVILFDEPTAGMSRGETEHAVNLIRTLSKGKTLVVVEHDTQAIRCADHVVELGPGSGEHGGEVVFEGHPDRLPSQNTGL